MVSVHGEWTDGSSWNKVIPLLQRNSLGVTAVQIPLTSLSDDVAILRHVIGLQGSSTVLAGHCCGVSVITEAETDARPEWELKPSWHLISASDRMIPAVMKRLNRSALSKS